MIETARVINSAAASFALAMILLGAGCQATGPASSASDEMDAAVANPAAEPPPPDLAPAMSTAGLLDQARQTMDAGDYESALEMFREILAKNPTIGTAYVGIGEIHLQQRDYERAEPAFARAARLEPRNFDAQFGHGVALQMLNRFVDAVRAYQRALSIDPDHPRANLSLGTTYLQMDDPRSALFYAERAVELDPQNGGARVNLGAIYEKLGRNDEAISAYLTAMELKDDTAPIMLNLINVLGREKRYQEAVNTAENLVKLEPSANAYERLGWGYFRLGEYEKSINAYRDAVEIDPSHWPSWSGVGVNALNTWLLSERQNTTAFREARDAFRRSLRINPDQQRLITLMSNYGL